MYRRYQNRETRSELICFMGAEPTRDDRANARGLRRALDDEGAECGGELLFGEAMFDQLHRRSLPKRRVLEIEIVAIESEEMPHRFKGGALVALLEGMRLGYRGQKSHREHDDIFFAIGEC